MAVGCVMLISPIKIHAAKISELNILSKRPSWWFWTGGLAWGDTFYNQIQWSMLETTNTETNLWKYLNASGLNQPQEVFDGGPSSETETTELP